MGGGGTLVFLRRQHDFKISLPLYFLQLDWQIRSFISNLENLSLGFAGRPW